MNTEIISLKNILSIATLLKVLVVLSILSGFSIVLASAMGIERWITFCVVFSCYFVTVLFYSIKHLPPTTASLLQEVENWQNEYEILEQDLEQSEANAAALFESKENFKALAQQNQNAVKQMEKGQLEIINNYEQQLKTARDKLSKLENEASVLKQINKQAEQTINSFEQIEANYIELKAKFEQVAPLMKKYPGLFGDDPEALKADYTSRQRALAGAKRGKGEEG